MVVVEGHALGAQEVLRGQVVLTPACEGSALVDRRVPLFVNNNNEEVGAALELATGSEPRQGLGLSRH